MSAPIWLGPTDARMCVVTHQVAGGVTVSFIPMHQTYLDVRLNLLSAEDCRALAAALSEAADACDATRQAAEEVRA